MAYASALPVNTVFSVVCGGATCVALVVVRVVTLTVCVTFVVASVFRVVLSTRTTHRAPFSPPIHLPTRQPMWFFIIQVVPVTKYMNALSMKMKSTSIPFPRIAGGLPVNRVTASIVVLTAGLTTAWFVGSLPQITTTVIFPHVALFLFVLLPSLSSFVPWLLANGVRRPGRFVKDEDGDNEWTPGRVIIPGVGQLSDPSTRRAVQEATLKAHIAAAMVSFIVLAGFLPFYTGDDAWSRDAYVKLNASFFEVAVFNFRRFMDWIRTFWPTHLTFMLQLPMVSSMCGRGRGEGGGRGLGSTNPTPSLNTQTVSLTVFVLDTLQTLYVAWELENSKRRGQLEAAPLWLRVVGWSSALVERMMLGIAATHQAATNYVTASKVYGMGGENTST